MQGTLKDYRLDIQRLHQSLEDMTVKYTKAQIQISEHIQATSKILQCSSNSPKTLSLEIQSRHHCSTPDTEPTHLQPVHISQKPSISRPSIDHSKDRNKVFFFSDNIGIGYGALLN